jgi:hypothetical protein
MTRDEVFHTRKRTTRLRRYTAAYYYSKKNGKRIQKLQQEITGIFRGTPAPNSSSRPRRLRARAHAAVLVAIRVRARAAAALVAASVPSEGALHMCTTQLVAHHGAPQRNMPSSADYTTGIKVQ